MARVNEGSLSFTCHPHVYSQVEWNIPAFTPQPQSITALWLVLISHPAEGRRLSWPGWLGEILRWWQWHLTPSSLLIFMFTVPSLLPHFTNGVEHLLCCLASPTKLTASALPHISAASASEKMSWLHQCKTLKELQAAISGLASSFLHRPMPLPPVD